MRATMILSTALLAIQCACFAAEPSETPRKKLIELGWDIPTTRYIRDHWREMEANAPFDGVMYDLTATTADGARCASQNMFSPDRWNRDDFKDNIDDLNACAFERYRENFVRINFHPANFGWFDDDGWSAVCEKGAICAWVAKETRGSLCFDFESYGAALFRYDAASGKSFEETKRQARRRGAEFCKAIADEYPNVTILCLWMNSINYSAGSAPEPDVVLKRSGYGLLPSFIDGLLDAAPSEMRFVEGCENGYYMNGVEEYQRASLNALLTTGPGARLTSPENRRKYRLQVSSGFGFYLDMYSNPEGSVYYRGAEPGETRYDRLRANLRAAWDAADEYVWVYGEQLRWWAPENGGEWKSWEEAFPGFADFLLELSAPDRALRAVKERIERDSHAESLIVDGDFNEIGANGSFTHWGVWRHEDSHGRFAVSKGVARIQGDTNACYLQGFEVEPGESYFIVGQIGTRGAATGSFTARWQDASGRWVAQDCDVPIYPPAEAAPDAAGCVEAFGRVVAPPSARRLVLLLSCAADDSEGSVDFRAVRAYKL